ncbi:hypothetical protein [Chakrabartyella piscis]|uniref:hypothetical protein n=1 Tax=Chakrabartyella piscis TaxID=2918914 RepID=UPI0029588A49|nr:hypothetical protein [Chakrabartyella piscis]
MNLSQKEIEQFYKLWYTLVWRINKKHKVIPFFPKPIYENGLMVSQEKFMEVRDKMWENPQWIDEFLAEYNNGEFTEKEREIIQSWREHFIKDRFIIVKHLKNYSVFMRASENQVILYGAMGISDSFHTICRGEAPLFVSTVLIPFGDKIIYDTFLVMNNIHFGTSLRKGILNDYRKAKADRGIITSITT